MDKFKLNATVREGTGKGVGRKLRAKGKVPAIVYGAGITPVKITLDHEEMQTLLLTGKSMQSLIGLTVEGREDLSSKPMMFKEIQRHHITRFSISADLYLIDAEKELPVPVPIILIGDPKGTLEGGVTQHLLRSIIIYARIEDIPDLLEIDIAELMPGETLYVEDLTLPEGTSTRMALKDPVCTMTIPRGYADEEEAGEEEEGEEGEEGAEGEEGESGEKAKEEGKSDSKKS
jgi:large subunit ribosomal protein L25